MAARTSSFRFRGNDVPVDSIGRALRVGHVLEGSVRQYGPRVRITAQLIETNSGYHLWSATYDRELRDVFAVQDEISRAIVQQLQVRLTGGRASRGLARQETADAEAHALVLKGSTCSGRPRAKATRRRPSSSSRPSGATRVRPRVRAAGERPAGPGVPPLPSAGRGLRARQVAREPGLALDPGMLTAHATLARIAEMHEWDFRAAEAHYRGPPS